MADSLLDRSLSIQHAREEFLNRGRLEKGKVAEEIERSWRRCLESGMDAATPKAELLTASELRQRQEQHHLLLEHAKPEMETLNQQIAHTRSLVILTDDDGVILHSLGDTHFLSSAEQVALLPGSSWNENQRGTNAIGTALLEAAPLTVQGAEHFIERHHVLSCSAVPIFGKANQVLGTLDVSNDFLIPQQHTLALVKMAAQMVENRLFKASTRGDIVLHFHARPEFLGTLWEGTAIFDSDGRLTGLNRSGQFQLGANPAPLESRQVRIDQIFDITPDSLQPNLVFPLKLHNGARLYAKAEFRQDKSSRVVPLSPPKAKRDCAANLDMLDTGDAQIAKAIHQVKRVLSQDIAILIEGETGAGKELFARAVHEASDRNQGPWIAVNCAALPEGLIESELFGYEEGAFTGARRKGNTGKLEQANGGTLFLDEIGDMPLALQARLLRVLQERSVTPLGSNKAKLLDFRLLSATNHQLREKVERGEFRRDLYYRLNGLRVSLPPLRERSDLAALIDLILQIENAAGCPITQGAMDVFQSHPWPGNIRQLHNVLRTSLALAAGESIGVEHLPQDFIEEWEFMDATAKEKPLSAITLDVLQTTLHKHKGNVSAAARELGISRNTFYRKLNQDS